ncbi:MAG: thioester reductase domain-containing protein [Algicola sp.]|nr:thioester reductase domain-containing protein [Algicola sp.]
MAEQQRVSLAYTLQTGRKVMEHRIGFVVSSLVELKQALASYSATATSVQTQMALEQQKYQDILDQWIETGFTDWDSLYQGEKVPKMSLPSYPFSLKAYELAHTQSPSQTTFSTKTVAPILIKEQIEEPVKPTLQLLTPQWKAKALSQQEHVDRQTVVFCEVPMINIEGATTKSLFSSGFSLEQKIEDYGYQLVQILKGIAKSKEQTTLQLVLCEELREGNRPNLYLCFHSLLKTASLECPTLKTQVILLNDVDAVSSIVKDNLASTQDQVIRYRNGVRDVLEYHQIASAAIITQTETPFKADGVYLITGGLGGIGSRLIEDINRRPFHKTIITTGRKPADHPQVLQQLAALNNDKTTLKYYQVDVSIKMKVIRLVRDILSEFKTLTGVVHAAGVLKDQLFVNKTQDAFKQVLAPKVSGVIALDEATLDLPLDFFICFGALSGVHGAFTQIDYAMANAFLDSYMHYRESLVVKGDRSGKSCSIDWPYWQDGGMKINPQFEKMMSKNGVVPMPSDIGISAFYQSLRQVQTLVVYEQEKTAPTIKDSPVMQRFESLEQLKKHLSDNLLNITASLLGVNKNDIDPDADLGDIGADSIVIVSFINQLNKLYQLDLSPTLLFKYSTLNSLLTYLLEEHGASLTGGLSVGEAIDGQGPTQTSTEEVTEERIAIIGISGEFPQAKNVDEFWENLVQAKDCVTRRSWSGEGSQDFPSEIQWLGNVARDHKFDPLFFNIAPAESPRIHLQERLLMMHVYKCIEDAGYEPASLAGSNTGIFIGCQSGYHDGMVTSNAFAPNRMSYFLDLHGPSEGIDTTCSSSLVAIHKAIQAIQQGDCDQAIVGGVNIIDSPKASLALHEIGVLSPTGRCKTFSNDADGFVRGEGVGMIFIKKLSACKKDNDAMYATILGSALNHGGKSQGFTVPNANAQSKLLEKAWQTAGIDPSTLSYIECHGTGTSLGDPVEVDALKDAFDNTFKETTTEQSRCALGSVKSNIGHLEIAAGIAGVIKVLLQFKHKTLVPSLHVNELNPYLALDNTPFTVQTKKEAWTCSGKRRAAVSSFGISGVNAHLVLEEIVEEADDQTETKAPAPAQKQDQWLILNNSWAASVLTCPVDWKSNIVSALRDQRILVVSQTTQEQAPLLSLMNETQVESMLFNQLYTQDFTPASAPDVVLYLTSEDSTDSIDIVTTEVKYLYQFMQSIEKLESKPIQLFFASFIDDHAVSREDITALLRSYSLRNPAHQWSMVEFACPVIQINWAEKLLQELVCPRLVSKEAQQPNHIQYRQQQRFGIQLQRMPSPLAATSPTHFKKNGVYLIAGALGELGDKLSRCLLAQYDATLILLGRRSAQQCQAQLAELNKLSGSVHYHACDIANESDLKLVAQYLDKQEMTLNGIFHLGTSFTQDETCWDDFEQSMKVKVQGSLMLDTVFSDTELDFFILFSSMAVFGSLNHLSYSYGNGFQNTFSSYRNALVAQKQRHGKTLALNWGYWHSDDPVKSIENSFAEKKGYALIKMDEAFVLMQSLLASDKNTLGVVLSHDKDKIYQNTSKLLLSKTVQKEASVISSDIEQSLASEQLSVADTVINIISNVIGITPDELDLEGDLFEYGFDSIALLKTFQQLKKQLTIDIQADAFKNMNTIQSLIDDIEDLYQQADEKKVESTPEFILDAGLAAISTEGTTTNNLPKVFEGDIKSVFLTGATGFLGGHILHQLLTTTQATIYCLVRAKTIKKAQERILQNAASYKLNVDMNRIVPILGDMEQPQLGMSKKNWHLLCKEVQHIVHTASYVNHIQPYFAFKKSVKGTTKLLSMAYTNTIKMIHFVSSTTVSNQVKNSHFSVNPVEDFIDTEKAEMILSGYGQSKWIQEENIRLASLAGVPYTIYRFSEISGSSQTGIGNTNDIFHRILHMMLSVPVRTDDANYLIDIIPVDIAASTIVKGMNDPSKHNKVYNVANPNPLTIAQFYSFAATHDLSFAIDTKETFIDACKDYASHITNEDEQVIMQGLLTSRPGYDEYLFETYFMPLDPYHKDNFLNLVTTYDIDFVEWKTLFDTYFKQWKDDRYYQSLWGE